MTEKRTITPREIEEAKAVLEAANVEVKDAPPTFRDAKTRYDFMAVSQDNNSFLVAFGGDKMIKIPLRLVQYVIDKGPKGSDQEKKFLSERAAQKAIRAENKKDAANG